MAWLQAALKYKRKKAEEERKAEQEPEWVDSVRACKDAWSRAVSNRQFSKKGQQNLRPFFFGLTRLSFGVLVGDSGASRSHVWLH